LQAPTYYYVPPQQSTAVSEPLIPAKLPLAERLVMRDYEVRTSMYFDEAWALFKKYWLAWVAYTLVFIVQF
jgi:hypothetical protein